MIKCGNRWKMDKKCNKEMTPMQLLQNAPFHGANSLADKRSRWFWLPSLLLLVAPAITLVMLTISRYYSNPTYIARLETVQNQKKFPSVVLYPPLKFVEKRMDEFVDKIKYPEGMTRNHTREILPQLGAFISPDVPYTSTDLERLEQLLDYNGLDIETVGKELTASCEETIIKCRWSRKIVNCSTLFDTHLCGDGFCCVFNGRSLRAELQKSERTKKPISSESTHWYTNRFGFTSGLILAIDQTEEPTDVDLGYKWIGLQTSQRFVDTIINGTALNPGSENWISYFTHTFSIGEGAKSLSPDLRKCKMSYEALKYFPLYGKRYCLLEREMENTIKLCHCLRVVHPKLTGVPRCSARMLQCAARAMVPYSSEEFKCPSTCDIDRDTYQVSSFSLTDSAIMDPFYYGLDLEKVSIIRIFIQNRKQMAKERWSLYSQVDLFSQLGGMFSIFFGCSVLTLLAFLQIACRLVASWYRARTTNKSIKILNKSTLKKRI